MSSLCSHRRPRGLTKYQVIAKISSFQISPDEADHALTITYSLHPLRPIYARIPTADCVLLLVSPLRQVYSASAASILTNNAQPARCCSPHPQGCRPLSRSSLFYISCLHLLQVYPGQPPDRDAWQAAHDLRPGRSSPPSAESFHPPLPQLYCRVFPSYAHRCHLVVRPPPCRSQLTLPHGVYPRCPKKIKQTKPTLAPNSPITRAHEAARTQLVAVARKWMTQGTAAFGALGEIGSAQDPNAIEAWIKATDGKVTTFDDGSSARVAIDAGRVLIAPSRSSRRHEAPPPVYEPPPPAPGQNQDEAVTAALVAAEEAGANDSGADEPSAPLSRASLEVGRARLALLKQQLDERRQQELAATNAAATATPVIREAPVGAE